MREYVARQDQTITDCKRRLIKRYPEIGKGSTLDSIHTVPPHRVRKRNFKKIVIFGQ